MLGFPYFSRSVLYSGLYLFCLFATIFVLRPLRDHAVISSNGIADLRWIYMATLFVAILICLAIVRRLGGSHARKVASTAHYLLAAQLLLFYLAYDHIGYHIVLVGIFFIWLATFSLLSVSMFWGQMSVVHRLNHAHRVYGIIAGMGSLGACTGSYLAAWLAAQIQGHQFVLVAAFLLCIAGLCTRLLDRHPHSILNANKASTSEVLHTTATKPPIFFRALRGPWAKIALSVLLYSAISTFLYYQLLEFVSQTGWKSAQRLHFFSLLDLGMNTLTLIGQFLITRPFISFFGIAGSQGIIPLLVLLGLIIFLAIPSLTTLVFIFVVHRVGSFCLLRPGREILFRAIEPKQRVAGKTFVDTVVYRSGDLIAIWFCTALPNLGHGIILAVVLLVAIAWLYVSVRAGLDFDRQMKHGVAHREDALNRLDPLKQRI